MFIIGHRYILSRAVLTYKLLTNRLFAQNNLIGIPMHLVCNRISDGYTLLLIIRNNN